MDNNTITPKMTLQVDSKWSAQMSEENLVEYLAERLNSSPGLRGQAAAPRGT
jgi:hypothetical protein